MGKEGTAFSQATHIAYTYDDLRQVTDAERFEGVDFNDQSSPVLLQTFAYSYDDIRLRPLNTERPVFSVRLASQSRGFPFRREASARQVGNRLLARLGSSGSPIEETTYTPNLLNQYSQVSGFSSQPSYDSDGNLIEQDGWEYIWDGDGARQREDGATFSLCPKRLGRKGGFNRVPYGRVKPQNRLIEAKVKVPTSSADRRLTFVYDADGRRVEKKVYDWDNGWLPLRTHTFVWSGWDMLLEHIEDEVAETSETIAYLWGLDLAGSQDVTGNVGALLAIETDTVSGVYFYLINRNGHHLYIMTLFAPLAFAWLRAQWWGSSGVRSS